MATDPIGAAGLPTPQSRPNDPSKTESAPKPDPRPESAAAEETPAASGPGAEKVQISDKAREMLAMRDLMGNARSRLDEHPDVRAERVREVRERLKAGVYDTGAIRDELAHRLASLVKDLPLD